jgi:hypothetical protein
VFKEKIRGKGGEGRAQRDKRGNGKNILLNNVAHQKPANIPFKTFNNTQNMHVKEHREVQPSNGQL